MGDCVVIVDDVNINKPKLYPFSYKVQITNTQFMLSLNDKKKHKSNLSSLFLQDHNLESFKVR